MICQHIDKPARHTTSGDPLSSQLSMQPRWQPLLPVVVLAAMLVGCSDKAEKQAPRGPTEVGVVTLKTERQVVTTELPGRTNAYLSAEIRPQVGGIVQKRLFMEGASVKAGQVLYQLDASSFEAAHASAQATLSKAQASVNAAEANARRNAELVKIDAISQQVYDDSQVAVIQARADVAVAKAALESARINLSYTRIVAPISGRTTLSTVTPGALVTANQTMALTTVSQIDPLYVDITQSSTDVLKLKNDLAKGRFQRSGQGEAQIALQLEDGSKYAYPGKLQFSGVNVNTGTGAVTLRAVVPNPDGVLMPGMYVRAVLEAGVNEQALLVPQQSVTRDASGGANVLVVDTENKIQRRKIVLDAAVGNRWQVASGLTAGDRVVIDGLQRVKVSDTVKATEVTPRPAAGASAKSTKTSEAAVKLSTSAASDAR